MLFWLVWLITVLQSYSLPNHLGFFPGSSFQVISATISLGSLWVLAPCHASCAVRVTFRATMVAAIKIQVWGWHLAQAVEYKHHFLVPAVAKIPASSGGFLVALKAAASPFCCACSQMCCSRNPCICLAHGMCALPALPYFLSRYIYSL